MVQVSVHWSLWGRRGHSHLRDELGPRTPRGPRGPNGPNWGRVRTARGVGDPLSSGSPVHIVNL